MKKIYSSPKAWNLDLCPITLICTSPINGSTEVENNKHEEKDNAEIGGGGSISGDEFKSLFKSSPWD